MYQLAVAQLDKTAERMHLDENLWALLRTPQRAHVVSFPFRRDDYDTVDGTGVRDYLHVMDLVDAHLAALRYLEAGKPPITCNLGTGRGHSVLEVVKALEKASGKKILYDIKPRRPGDIAASYADPRLAARELGWRATLGLDEMCRDAWRWQSDNPGGYPD